jgi:NAD(P)-dependent dehydrogenase (short-subunit alcohol dehydrogenase family)
MSTASFRLDNRVALLTGAARGIGMGIARAFSAAGCAVAIQDIDAESANAAALEINSSGGKAVALVGDLADLSHVQSLIPSTLNQLGRLDILVNNGAIQQQGFLAGTLSIDEVEKQFRVNMTVPMYLLKEASQYFIDQQIAGRIINLSSVQSRKGDPRILPYSMTKAAIDNLTRTSARALAKHSITVNSIAPGMFNTVRNQSHFADPEKVEQIKQWLPLGRHGEPIDVAGAALLFASDAGSYITGQTLFVDGGLSVA